MGKKTGVGVGVERWLQMHTTIAEDPCSITNIQDRLLMTARNPSCRGSDACGQLRQLNHMCMHVCKLKKIFQKKIQISRTVVLYTFDSSTWETGGSL